MKAYLNELRYALHVIVHPFDGFWDLKHEKRGSLRAALTILFLMIAVYAMSRRYTDFIFNPNNLKTLNSLTDVAGASVLFLLWVVANWSLTTLTDGKGTFRDIVIFSSYALTPYVLISLPLILLSYCFSLEELAIYNALVSIAYVWSAVLLLFGMLVTHEYTLGKTFLTVIGVFIAMALIIFLAMLLLSIVQEIISLVLALYKEIKFRI